MTTGAKRASLTAIVVSTLAIGSAYATAFAKGGSPAWAGWLFAAGVTGALVGTLALGAMRAEVGLGRLIGPFLLMTAIIGAGFVAVFALPDLGAAEPLLLGLPRRAAIVLYGIGLLPTFVLPVAYALTFADQTLRPEDLERVLATARVAAEARALAERADKSLS